MTKNESKNSISSVEIHSENQEVTIGIKSVMHHDDLTGRDLPNQHSISSITGLDNALQQISDKTFVFEQAIPSDTWKITHNLDKKPSVTVVDSADNVFYPAVQYINNNELVVSMNGATTGKAYLN